MYWSERTDLDRYFYVLSEGRNHWLYETDTGKFIGVYRSVDQARGIARQRTRAGWGR